MKYKMVNCYRISLRNQEEVIQKGPQSLIGVQSEGEKPRFHLRS